MNGSRCPPDANQYDSCPVLAWKSTKLCGNEPQYEAFSEVRTACAVAPAGTVTAVPTYAGTTLKPLAPVSGTRSRSASTTVVAGSASHFDWSSIEVP